MKPILNHDEASEIVKNNPDLYRVWINPIPCDYDELQRFTGKRWISSRLIVKDGFKAEWVQL